MKAIVRETYGPPEVLHLVHIPLPTVGEDDVLVSVRAASANAGDWHLLRGTPLPFRLVAGLRTPKFKIIGTDIAGYVEAVGRNVTRFRPGDEVFGSSLGAALQGLRQGRIKRGQQVLINGASGGVGTFAVQIAKAFGGEVTVGTISVR